LVPIDLQTEVIRLAFGFPYLMHALLGHAALHLSATVPDQREMWDIQAVGLHTTSVSMFRAITTTQSSDEDSMFAAYLFSTFISKHVLYHVLSAPTHDLDSILEGFTGFLRLQLGVPLLLSSGRQDLPIPSSKMHSVLRQYTTAITALESLAPVAALLPLHDMLANDVHLDPATRATYRTALNPLNNCYAAPTEALSAIAAFYWPTRLDSRFAAELARRSPEALVILTYYAVVLHRHRGNWLFGVGGGFVVEAVAGFLGREWEGWMRGAVEMVGGGGGGGGGGGEEAFCWR
jgi:hypothetical protein